MRAAIGQRQFANERLGCATSCLSPGRRLGHPVLDAQDVPLQPLKPLLCFSTKDRSTSPHPATYSTAIISAASPPGEPGSSVCPAAHRRRAARIDGDHLHPPAARLMDVKLCIAAQPSVGHVGAQRIISFENRSVAASIPARLVPNTVGVTKSAAAEL